MTLAPSQAYRLVLMSDEQDADAVVTFDWTPFDSPSMAVVSAVAEESGVDPVTITPLNEVIDPDALDTIVASSSYLHGAPDASIEFRYEDYWVIVKANGRGYLYDQAGNHQSTTESRLSKAPTQAD